MESRFINRYHTFCKCLNNLEKSKTASPDADFVLEGLQRSVLGQLAHLHRAARGVRPLPPDSVMTDVHRTTMTGN